MKQVFHKSFLTAVLAGILILVSSSCSHDNEQLKKVIEAANEECPVDVEGLITLTEMMYEDGNVGCVYTCSELYAVSISSVEEQTLKANVISAMAQQQHEFIKIVLDAAAGFNLYFRNAEGENVRTVRISGQEVKDLVDQYKKGTLKKPTFIEQTRAELENNKSSLPVEVADGLMLTNMEIEGSKIIYTYEVDSRINLNQSMEASTKSEVVTSLKNIYAARINELVSENVVFEYVYKNNAGDTLLLLTITPSDLQ